MSKRKFENNNKTRENIKKMHKTHISNITEVKYSKEEKKEHSLINAIGIITDQVYTKENTEWQPMKKCLRGSTVQPNY